MLKLRYLVALASAGLLTSAVLPASAAGTWTKAPVNTATGGNAFGLWMLTDGTVLSHGNGLQNFVILSPDAKGNYTTGTWKKVAGKTHARGGAQQHVLKDGRFLELGGEYVDGPACTPALCASGEIYDPIKNTWTDITPAPFGVADTGSCTLSDGRILESQQTGNKIAIYDPATDTWTALANSPLGIGQENSWAELQNGGILAVGYASAGATIYNPATQKFVRTGAVPSGFNTGDTGGISLMFDGRVFVYGLNSKSYIYTPGPTAADPGTWANGPTMLKFGAEDEFTNTMPDGRVFGALVDMTYGPGVALQAFDPTTNTVSSIAPPPDGGNPYPIGYVNLPNGQVMVTAANNNWIYTSDLQPQDAWRPTVTSVTFNSGSSYSISGTQLSGLINGSDEGDDMTNQQNFPIVWLKNSAGNVYYCRSSNFSSMVPSKGNTIQTADFTTPAALPAGSYDLYVSAVGVQSKVAFPFTTGMSSSGGAGGAGGASGAGGSAGASGSAGTSGGGTGGSAGASGTTSTAGASGTTSTAGASGTTSTAGASGDTSTAGASGSTSTAGASGAATAGDSGSTSTAGASGAATAGASGAATAGASGSTSTAGASGAATAGASGTPNSGAGGVSSGGDQGSAGTSFGEPSASARNSPGCSCKMPGGSAPAPTTALLPLLGMLGLLRYRRRSARA